MSRASYNAAERMAKDGYGVEDICVALRNTGLTQYEADFAVFGKAIAMRRDARRRWLRREAEMAS